MGEANPKRKVEGDSAPQAHQKSERMALGAPQEVACTRMYFVTEMPILPQDRHYIEHFLSEMESGELQENYHGIPIYIVFLAQQQENFLGPTF